MSIARTRTCRAAVAPRRMRGFGLLETMLIVVLIGTALAVGFVYLKAAVPAEQARAQEDALAWADSALTAYAAAHARLPCPASTPGGEEDCTLGAKGWLPTTTLEDVTTTTRLDAAGPGRAAAPMRYMVYRGGGGTDLAAIDDGYDAPQWDSDNSPDAGYTYGTDGYGFGAVNGLDLCSALDQASNAGLVATNALVPNRGGTSINVAYGIAAAGATAGDNGRFDLANADNTASMESPSRSASSSYDDRVRVRDFESLSQSMNCGVTVASIEALARAVNVVEEAENQRQANIADGILSSALAGVSLILQGVNMALAGASMVSAGVTVGTASAQLAGAIASCIVLVGCALIPPYTTALALSIAALVASGVSLGLQIAAFAVQSAALGMFIAAASMAGDPPGGVAAPDRATMITLTCNQADEADAKLVEANTDRDRAIAERNAAANNMNSWHGSITDSTSGQGLKAQYQSALLRWTAAKHNYQLTLGARDIAQKNLDALDESITIPRDPAADAEMMTQCLAAGSTQAECDALIGNDGLTAIQKCSAATATYNLDTSNQNNKILMDIACDAVADRNDKAVELQAELTAAQNALTAAQTELANAKAAYGTANNALQAADEVCSYDNFFGWVSLSCPSIWVGASIFDGRNANFNAAPYCDTRSDYMGDDGNGDPIFLDRLHCSVNRLRAREEFYYAMGYMPEQPVIGNPGDDNYFNPANTLSGSDATKSDTARGYTFWFHRAEDATAAAVKAADAAVKARAACDDIKKPLDPTSSGTQPTLYGGAEDILKQAENRGTVGAVKPATGL